MGTMWNTRHFRTCLQREPVPYPRGTCQVAPSTAGAKPRVRGWSSIQFLATTTKRNPPTRDETRPQGAAVIVRSLSLTESLKCRVLILELRQRLLPAKSAESDLCHHGGVGVMLCYGNTIVQAYSSSASFGSNVHAHRGMRSRAGERRHGPSEHNNR